MQTDWPQGSGLKGPRQRLRPMPRAVPGSRIAAARSRGGLSQAQAQWVAADLPTLDIDRGAGLGLNVLDRGARLADDEAGLLDRDLHRC